MEDMDFTLIQHSLKTEFDKSTMPVRKKGKNEKRESCILGLSEDTRLLFCN